MNRPLLIVIACASLCLVAGCATPYHSEGVLGGYSEKQLSPDTFEIHFTGNGYVSQEKAKDFVMLHACEVCLQHGFNGFVVLKGNLDESVVVDNNWFYGKFVDITIRACSAAPEGTARYYSAATLQQPLKQKYHIK